MVLDAKLLERTKTGFRGPDVCLKHKKLIEKSQKELIEAKGMIKIKKVTFRE